VSHGAGKGDCDVVTVAVVVADAVAPALSVTVRVTVKEPVDAYVCDADDKDEVVSEEPSPQRHV